MAGRWVVIRDAGVPLRCWWNKPQREVNDVVLVLPEVFGVNNWVRSVVDRFAEKGVPSLAMPLFARTAPNLDLDYGETDLIQGRQHKEATTTEQILADTSAAIQWLKRQNRQSKITVIGFCFGGHASLVTATLPDVNSTFDFYGAGVVTTRPGGGPPSLEFLNKVSGRLTVLCGTADSLIPLAHRDLIKAALLREDPERERFNYVEIEGADHGFMCQQRQSFNAEASALCWRLLMQNLNS